MYRNEKCEFLSKNRERWTSISALVKTYPLCHCLIKIVKVWRKLGNSKNFIKIFSIMFTFSQNKEICDNPLQYNQGNPWTQYFAGNFKLSLNWNWKICHFMYTIHYKNAWNTGSYSSVLLPGSDKPVQATSLVDVRDDKIYLKY